MSAVIGSLLLGALLNFFLNRLFEASIPVKRDLEKSARILYGYPLDITDYPYFVQLRHCGGAILSEHWVITAAHCVDNIPSIQRFPQPIWVGGETEKNSKKYTYNRIIIHPNYMKYGDYDIALLRVTQRIKFSRKVKAIDLPKYEFENGDVVLVGKGKDENNEISDIVQRVLLFAYSGPQCNVMQNDITFCARRKGYKAAATCYGDSGSPLVRNNTLIGLALSIDRENCDESKITHCLNVARFVSWIKGVTGL